MSDIHDRITSQMFGVPVSQVTPAQRQLAQDELDKWVNEFVEYRNFGRLIKYCLIVGFLLVLLGICIL